jgi:hypothetical protein
MMNKSLNATGAFDAIGVVTDGQSTVYSAGLIR